MSLNDRITLPYKETKESKHGTAGLILGIISLVIVLAFGITDIITSSKRDDTIQNTLVNDINNLNERILRLENEITDLKNPKPP